MATVLITGSSGNTGSAVVNILNNHGVPLRAGVSAKGGNPPADSGVETVICDYREPDQIQQSLQGVNRAYLMVPFNREMVEWGRRFVEAASEAGVRFVVRLSGLGAAPDSASAMGRLHGEIDQVVKDSGIDYCILRCNSFMQNYSGHYAHMIRRGTLRLAHGDAKFNFIDTDDIAEVVSRVLLNPTEYASKTLDLHGPQCLSNLDAVEIIGRATGKDIQYEPISDEEAANMLSRGKLGAWEQNIFASLDKYFRDGYAEGDPAQLREILDREAGMFTEFVLRQRQCWL